MRKNRRIKKEAVVTTGSAGIFALIFCVCIAMLVYWSLDQRCTTIGREIGKAERTIKSLETELGRENMKWAEMTSPQKLDEKLVRFGIQMRRQALDQVVKMNIDGRPAQGLAVQRALNRNRMKSEVLAGDSAVPSSTKKPQRVRR